MWYAQRGRSHPDVVDSGRQLHWAKAPRTEPMIACGACCASQSPAYDEQYVGNTHWYAAPHSDLVMPKALEVDVQDAALNTWHADHPSGILDDSNAKWQSPPPSSMTSWLSMYSSEPSSLLSANVQFCGTVPVPGRSM